jgi:hypothetical protein
MMRTARTVRRWKTAPRRGGAGGDKVQINLLKMLTEQQFIIIRQNEQIIRLLDRQLKDHV